MSGIYIKGISMPTGCETCYFHRWVDIGVGTCAGCELLKELMNDDRDRLPNCPLIPVPDHGRLIDVRILENMHFTERVYDAESKLFVPFAEVASALFNAPTIIPADFAKDNTEYLHLKQGGTKA